jgi:transcriptional regulator with XRE-family HTH domain
MRYWRFHNMHGLGDMMSEYGDKLKDRRRNVHLTQQRLADLAGVKLSMIADIESDRQQPNENTVQALEKILGNFEAEFRHTKTKGAFIAARIKAGITQEEVARKAKIDPIIYSSWEAGQAQIDEASVLAIHSAIDEIAESKRDKSGPGSLALLAGRPEYVMNTWEEEEKKESERVFNVLSDRSLVEDIRRLEQDAAKVPGLESEIAELKAEVAALNAQIAGLKKKKRAGKVRGV